MPCPVDGVTRDGRRVRRRRRRRAPCARRRSSIATGGLTVPKIGATPFGYRLAEQFGLPVVPPRPALVPLAFAPEALARYGDLSGVSRRRRGRRATAGAFARTCCSRIAGCRARRSCRSRRTGTAATPLVDRPAAGRRRRGVAVARARVARRSSPTLLAERLPRRFAQQWCAAHGVGDADEAAAARRGCATIAATLHDWRVLPSGTLGYNKAEVTLRRRRHARAVVEDDGGDATCPASTSSAKSSTSPAGSAATTSSGRGRRATPPGRPSDGTCAADRASDDGLRSRRRGDSARRGSWRALRRQEARSRPCRPHADASRCEPLAAAGEIDRRDGVPQSAWP